MDYLKYSKRKDISFQEKNSISRLVLDLILTPFRLTYFSVMMFTIGNIPRTHKIALLLSIVSLVISVIFKNTAISFSSFMMMVIMAVKVSNAPKTSNSEKRVIDVDLDMQAIKEACNKAKEELERNS